MASSNEVSYNLFSQKAIGLVTPINSEEFQEEDIWGCTTTTTTNNIVNEKVQLSSKFIITSIKDPRRLIPTTIKMIPKSKNKNSVQDFNIVHHSAPINIHDWSKIYGTGVKKEIGNFVTNNSNLGSDDEEEVEENVMPPHEWLAKRLGRRQISSFSVCEGVGRTLKGRDLTRVRDIVLTKTGFLE
ncbi:protein S40-7-like [Lycium ferocissimum]|uniref:protein S40-7-like n=1 Tax=Lycium ferocissimum TaxID=112874 RepID=UPI0028168F7E|nr:protein S40-7-like [Lycium ferocissimum]XP_059301093.1 protein S40-7-like [Lycium ferocissimum]XP_059301094.1 protein S40-7-like [Lycium ferocissimum]